MAARLQPERALRGTGFASVIYIHGSSSVTLESLKLTEGVGTDFGGGIHFTGTGSLTLIDSTITNNGATFGAGIQFNGSGGNATLTLGVGTIIEQNTATSDGGGIHINGSARLFALAPYTSVDSNSASHGYGGGIAVIGPARADIGSPGYNGAAISYNMPNPAAALPSSTVAAAKPSCANLRRILRSQQPSIAIPHQARAVAYS